MSYKAQILKDSISPLGIRLTTFEVTFPRFILAEFNTHRVLSRNSASSRAIPLAKQIKKLQIDPFIPESFPTEKKGMSGGEPLHGMAELMARDAWLVSREHAIKAARKLDKLGAHKSICNRLLEPYMWHTVIATGTDWSNFFALRTDENAQPEFRRIALMMRDLYIEHDPHLLQYGEWHLPLVSQDELASQPAAHNAIFKPDWEFWKRISVGRCARVSYLTHDGVRDLDKDVALCEQLLQNGHLSPFEHVATPIRDVESRIGNFQAYEQYRKQIPYESNFGRKLLETVV